MGFRTVQKAKTKITARYENRDTTFCIDFAEPLMGFARYEVSIQLSQVGEGCEGAFQFACWDGQCLDINQQCDGVTDCSGGEDEQECPESSVYDIGEEIVSYDAQDFEDESEDEEEEDSGLFGFW